MPRRGNLNPFQIHSHPAWLSFGAPPSSTMNHGGIKGDKNIGVNPTTTLDTLYAWGYWNGTPANYDQFNIQIATAQATSNVRLGIYEMGSDFFPGALVADSGAIDTSTTGVKTAAASFHLDGPKMYWAALVADTSGIEVKTRQVDRSSAPLAAYTSANTNGPLYNVSRAFTFAALPDPFGGPPTWAAELAMAFMLRYA